jgi:putative membrane protein
VTVDRRNVRTLLLVIWSGFLLWLWATGETVRYLGPRTEWLVPFGGITLGLAALAYARSSAGDEPSEPLSRAELAGFVALVLPLVAGLLLANTQLGALAASKKLTARGIDPSALAELASRNASQLSFAQLKVAEHNQRFAAENNIQPGRDVRLVGFVADRPKGRRGTFQLARFYITCCVADSVPIGVSIDPDDPRAPSYERDDWLDVSGELVRKGRSLRLRATRIARVKAPHDPYLSFSS